MQAIGATVGRALFYLRSPNQHFFSQKAKSDGFALTAKNIDALTSLMYIFLNYFFSILFHSSLHFSAKINIYL